LAAQAATAITKSYHSISSRDSVPGVVFTFTAKQFLNMCPIYCKCEMTENALDANAGQAGA
jgi:hypothetical protein